MATVTRILFRTLTHSYIVCLIAIVSALLGAEGNFLTNVMEFIALYGSIITIYIFVIYLVSLLLSILFKRK